MIQHVSMTLLDSFFLTPRVKHFVLKVTEPSLFKWIAGQFLTIHFEHQGVPLKRSYSIANAPSNEGIIEFAAGFVEKGPGTEYLFGLNEKDIIDVSGPFGKLILKEPLPKRLILIGTSTGVTPYRSMIPALITHLQQNKEFEVVVLQGVQYSKDILYRDDFETLLKAGDHRVTLRMQLSQEKTTFLPNEFSGYVQNSFSSIGLNPDTDMVYLCGNPGMIDEAFLALKNTGFSSHQIVREKYISHTARNI